MDFKELCVKYREDIEDELKNYFSGIDIDNEFLKEFYNRISKFVMGNGKRLRPLSFIAACSFDLDYLKLSLAFEIFHASSLIHDDIIDEDLVRRNNETFFYSYYDDSKIESSCKFFFDHKSKYSISMGILGGNIVSNMVFEIVNCVDVSDDIKKKIIYVLFDAIKKVNEGQILDIELENSEDVCVHDYFYMIEKKTAALFSACIECGLILIDSDLDLIENMKKYAKHIAIAFQIFDDIMDLDSSKGREIGSDIKEGKRTLLVIKLLEHCNDDEKKKVFDALGNKDCDVDYVISLMKDKGIILEVKQIAQSHVDKAKEFLEKVELSDDSYSYFKGLADYVINRNK